jgi:uncharacterized protein with beta-barrel porin domain
MAYKTLKRAITIYALTAYVYVSTAVSAYAQIVNIVNAPNNLVINEQDDKSYLLNSNNAEISISTTQGNLIHNNSNNYAISSAQDLIDLVINLNTQSSKGIIDSSLGAVNIDNSHLKNLTINAGLVTSSGLKTVNLNNIKNHSQTNQHNLISLANASSMISNTNSSGRVINYVGSNQEGVATNPSKLVIDMGQFSTLRSADSVDARVIYVDNAAGDVEITSRGYITSKVGGVLDVTGLRDYLVPVNNTAIEIVEANSFKLNLLNSSSTTYFYGNILNHGDAPLELTFGDNISIKSNIFLGTNPNSFVNSTGSIITGSVNFGDENQRFDLGLSFLIGTISGAGEVNLAHNNSVLALYSSTLDAQVNSSSADNNYGIIVVMENQEVIFNSDIGSVNPISSLHIQNSTADFLTHDKTIAANQILINNDSTIKLGNRVSEVDITSNIYQNGENSLVVIGGNYNLGGNINIGLGKVSVLADKSLTIGDNQINAAEIIVNESSAVNFGDGEVNTNIVASADGVGAVNFANNYTLNGNIGSQTNRLASVSLNNNSALNLADNEVHVIDFKIDENATLNIDANSKIFGNIIGLEDNFGTVNISGALTSNGSFGSVNSSLKNVNIAQNSNVNLGQNAVNSNNIDVAANAIITSSGSSTINLSDSGFNKIITIGDEAKIRNSNSGGSAINYSGVNQENITFNINGVGELNSTKIEGLNGAKAFNINNENANVTINNNSGSIIGDILIQGANQVSINNDGSFNQTGVITGNITVADDSQFNLLQTGSAIIGGNINLGSNALSSITSYSNIVGDIAFGNENQVFDLYNGVLLGTITNVGDVNLKHTNSALWLNSSILSANINADSANNGQIRVMNNQTVILQSDIGAQGKVKEFYVQPGATLDTSTHGSSISASNLYLDANSTLNLGSGSIAAPISKLNNISGSGIIVNVEENANLADNINIGLGSVVIAQGKSLDLNNNQITAQSITLNENSILNVEEGSITGDILSNGIGLGSVNFSENSEFLGNIGTLENPVANIIVANGKTVVLSENSLFSSNAVTLGDGASLDASLEQIVGNIIFQGNSSLTVNDELIDRPIEGSVGAIVNVKTKDNQETTTAVNIGEQTPLDSFEVGQNAILNLDVNNNSVSADSIKLNSSSTVNVGSGALNGDIVALNNNSGTINFNENNSLNGNVGSVSSVVSQINIAENKTLNLENFDLNSANTNLEQGSVLEVGSGSLNSTINAISNNVGVVNFNENNAISKNIGSSENALAEINFASSKVFEVNNSAINANEIAIAANAIVNANSTSNISGNVSLAQNAIFNVKDNSTISGAINGDLAGNGVVNIASSNIHNINYEVGNIHKLQEFNIAANSTANAYSLINANSVNVSGRLNLSNASGNSFSNNLTVKSGALLHLFDTSHNVGGNLSVESNATIIVDITSQNKAGSIEVVGSTLIAENAKLHLNISEEALSNISSNALSYKIIQSSDSDSSVVSNISNENIRILNNISKSLNLSTSIIDNSLFLNISQSQNSNNSNSGNSNVARNQLIIGETNGQRSLYKELANANNSQSLAIMELKQLIENAQSQSEMTAILEAANPQIDNSVNRISFENSAESLLITSKRINALRGVASGDGYTKSSIWAQTFGSRIKQGNNSISQGYRADSHGFAIGFDKEYAQDLIIGSSFSYSDSQVNSHLKDKRINIDSYQFNLYAGKDFDKYFTNAMIGVSYNQYNASRDISFANLTANSNYSGLTYIGKVDFGANYLLQQEFVLTPMLSITAAKNYIRNYRESGAQNYNLHVSNDSTSLFEARLGADISKTYKINKMQKIQPSLGASYGYDFAGSKQKTRSTFVGQNSGFSATSANMPQGSLRLSAGLKVYHLDSFSFDATYSLDKRNNYQAHTGSLRAKYEF